jgi:tRNA(adenine34) deaminase
MDNEHEKYMQLAVREAEKAGQKDEVPIGAVVVAPGGEILAMAHNQVVSQDDPTAHAEILALRAACRKIGNYRLLNTALYVTVEPCLMCMGAILHARLKGLVFGTPDPKWGGAGSLFDFSADSRLNHRVDVVAGVCEPVCRELMQAFFRAKRFK